MATEEENSPTPANEEEKPAAEEESSPVTATATEEEEPLKILETEEDFKPLPAAGKEKPPMPAVKQEDSPVGAVATEEENLDFTAVKTESFPVLATKEEEEEGAREQKRLRASTARNFPWAAVQGCRLMFTPPKGELEFKIYDPCEGEKREACFYLPDSSMFLDYNANAQYLSRVHASKDGWVLVEEESPVGARTITLFNPFTGQDCPAPENFDNHRISAATMTAGPESSDCILFVVFRSEKTGQNYLGSYRYEDDLWGWNILTIPDSDAAFRTVKSIVYFGGEAMLYFVYEDGKLWRFDYLDKFFTEINHTEIEFPIISLTLVEYEGEILLATRVILDTDQGLPEERYSWVVFKFNKDFLSWIQDGLHGMTLFLSATSFCVPASETIVVGNLEGCVCSFSGRIPRVYPVQRDREASWYVSLPTFYGCAHQGAVNSVQQSFWIEAPVLEEDN